MKKYVLMAVLAVSAPGALAAGGADQIYIGGGLGVNSVSGADDAVGFQFFGGYNLGNLGQPGMKAAIEVGYMDSGDFDSCFLNQCVSESATGLWATGVASFTLSPQASLIGRLGLDFGDDDGLIFGVGIGYALNRQMQLRGEFVIRDNIDSLQVNLTYALK